MSKKDIHLLLIVFGILIGFASWQFVYKPNQEKTETIKTENTTLQTEVAELEVLEAKREEYLAEIERMKEECTKITNNFASGLLTEDQIMYLYNMELVDANDVKVPSVTVNDATEIVYTSATTAAVTADTTTTDTADGTATEAAAVEVFQPVDEGIRLFDSKSTVSFTTTNNGFKNVIQYVYDIPIRKAISSVSMTTSNEGYLTGTMELDFYYMTGTDVPYSRISIPGVSTGTDNVFGVRDGAQNSNSTVTEEADSANEAEED